MRVYTSLITAALAIGTLVDVGGATGQSGRRDPPGVKTLDPDTIIADNSSRMSVLKIEYELADERITEYLQQAMLSIQQGHRTGFQHFRVWFRDLKEAEKRSSVSIAQEIMKQLFPGAFKLIFPGAGEIVDALEKVASGTIEVGGKMLEIPDGNIELFLDRLQAAEEERIAALLDMPKQFKADHPSEFAAAKLEYMEIRLQDASTLGPGALAAREEDLRRDSAGKQLPDSVLNILNGFGVPPPGSETARRVAEGVLESHIYTVKTSDPDWMLMFPYSYHQFATSEALKQMDKAGNKARICEVERSWTFWRTFKPNECAAVLPQ